MSEVDDALEDETPIYVYQAQIHYTNNELVLVRAYNLEHAQQIIKDSFKDYDGLSISHIQFATPDTQKSILNKTTN